MVVAISTPTQIVKRDGRTVAFNTENIKLAIYQCLEYIEAHKVSNFSNAENLTEKVVNLLSVKFANKVPTVEDVQDTVVYMLQSEAMYEEAEHYIIYRHEHAKEREANYIPPEVIKAHEEDEQYFPTPLQRFQFLDKYSRFNYELGRRETWVETVDRTTRFLEELAVKQNSSLDNHDIFYEIRQAILNMRVMPSMRLLAMAGEPARRNNAVLYNCSYLPIDSIESMCEVMDLLMHGCGVGFSVEFENIDKLPKVVGKLPRVSSTIKHVISDSQEGWVGALGLGLSAWFNGDDVEFDFSLIRPQGSVLRTKGGRASGPEPLRQLLSFIHERIRSRAGKKLRSIDVHDIVCSIGNAVVSGGVRRSALISLFDEDDADMITCKTGDNFTNNIHRQNANNSAVWKNMNDITQYEFTRRMMQIFEGGMGEPGIFARDVAMATMPLRRVDENAHYGCNPCGEIVLKPFQFCNLSIAVYRPDDTFETLCEKVRLATIIGTIQSTATYFPSLRSIWKVNCDKERLLGVDITGQYDSPPLSNKQFSRLQQIVIDTNKEFADLLGINPSLSTTCVKPSGNSAVLLNTSSGIHPRWSKYYIRNVRVTANSPMAKVLQEAGMRLYPDVGQDATNPNVWVVGFPVKSPDGAIVREDVGAIDQCVLYLQNKRYWTEHNPSVTIYYKPNEVLTLINWLWENRVYIGGMTFLPHSEGNYILPPYQEITEEEYNEVISQMPESIPFVRLYKYDNNQDNTNVLATPACEGPVCELPVQ